MNYKKLIKKVYFFGLGSKCIICNSYLRKMRPHGFNHKILDELEVIGGSRKNSQKCPICHSIERERLLFFYFNEKIKPLTTNGKYKILHVAPEKNFGKFLSEQKNCEYVSGDKYEKGYKYDSPYLDICDTNFNDNEFDLIICNHVLEHVIDYKKALTEIKRILKPNGRALLQVPIANKLNNTIEDIENSSEAYREERFGQYDHLRLFGKDYGKILINAGFNVNIYSSQELTHNKTNKFFLNPLEKVYEAVK